MFHELVILYEVKGGSTFKGVMNGEERSYGWVRPTSRHLSREFERRYGVRNSRSFVSKYSYRARFEVSCLCIIQHYLFFACYFQLFPLFFPICFVTALTI